MTFTCQMSENILQTLVIANCSVVFFYSKTKPGQTKCENEKYFLFPYQISNVVDIINFILV